ncbi:MAG: hypothetical protein ABIH90_02165 [Candidatus Aenigmatarchaeota archaeon]
MAPRRLKIGMMVLANTLLNDVLTATAIPVVLLLGIVAVPTHALKPLIGRPNKVSLREFFACARVFLWRQFSYH